MAHSWATFGADLHLDLDLRHPRVGLERALRAAVRDGRLTPGTRLPASRVLAADLGVARNTVAEAYGQLVAEGWLTARQGSGTSVADRLQRPITSADTQRGADSRAGAARFDLRPGLPDLAAFPRSAWLGATRRALAAAPNEAFGYGEPKGLPAVRATVAAYLARVRGVRADPERIVLTAGFAHALRLMADVLANRGQTTIAVEAYGHEAHRRALRAAGLATLPLTVDTSGASVEQLSRLASRAVLLTPAHQFPIGAVLAARRRRAVLDWANAVDGLVIEDDYDGEFRYDRQPVGAIQALDPERVVYAGSVSKTLAPGIRLGWLAVPATLVADVVAARAAADGGSSVVDQLALAELMQSGEYDRVVRRARSAYRRRRDRLVEVLARHSPAATVTGIAAGLHALVELPPGVTEIDAVRAAATRGLRIDALGDYATDRHDGSPSLVVGYSRPPEHAYTGALARLAATLASLAA